MTDPSSFRASRAIGAMFFSLFGATWLVLWSARSFGFRWDWLAIIALCTGVIFTIALRTYMKHRHALAAESDSPSRRKAGRVFNIVNAGQWILILIVGNVVNNLGHPEWVIPAAIFIIGAHLLPLAHVFNYSPHYITGGVMMLWGIGYKFLTSDGAASPVGCLGAGIALWSSAVYALYVKPPST